MVSVIVNEKNGEGGGCPLWDARVCLLHQQQPAARRPAPVAVVAAQRCVAAEPKQLQLLSADGRPPVCYSHPGALPSFTFHASHAGRPQPRSHAHPQPGVSVTSQFVKVRKEDGQCLFFPVRHIRRGKTAPAQPQRAVSGGGQRWRSDGGGDQRWRSDGGGDQRWRSDGGDGWRSGATPVPGRPHQYPTSPRSYERRLSMQTLAACLQRRNTVCVPDTPRFDVISLQPADRWSASGATEPGTTIGQFGTTMGQSTAFGTSLRQSTAFGRQICVSSLHSSLHSAGFGGCHGGQRSATEERDDVGGAVKRTPGVQLE